MSGEGWRALRAKQLPLVSSSEKTQASPFLVNFPEVKSLISSLSVCKLTFRRVALLEYYEAFYDCGLTLANVINQNDSELLHKPGFCEHCVL